MHVYVRLRSPTKNLVLHFNYKVTCFVASIGCIPWHLGGFFYCSTSWNYKLSVFLIIVLFRVHVPQLPGSAALCCTAAPSLLSPARKTVCVLHCSFLPSLLHPARTFSCAPNCPILPYAIRLFRMSPSKACQETSKAKIREGAVADWNINACYHVICTTADVAEAASKVLAILYLILLVWNRKPIPTPVRRFLPIDVSSFPYTVRTDRIQQWWKLQSAQEHWLKHEKIVSVGPSASVTLSESPLFKVSRACMENF